MHGRCKVSPLATTGSSRRHKGSFSRKSCLHQRGGMDYDKGCYLGQEVIARIYFKSAPKAFLHYVSGTGEMPAAGDKLDKIQVVNAIASNNGFEALVVARPEHLADSELTVLALPPALQADVARQP